MTKLQSIENQDVINEDEIFMERCPHDKENPYAQILNELIRNEKLTPDCRWLLIYLLSNEKGWKICVKQIVNHLKIHRGYSSKTVYKIIKEAIDAGYMKREQSKNGNSWGKVKYFISERPKFKKCLPLSQFGQAQVGHAQNGQALRRQSLLKKNQEAEEETISQNPKHEKIPGRCPPREKGFSAASAAASQKNLPRKEDKTNEESQESQDIDNSEFKPQVTHEIFPYETAEKTSEMLEEKHGLIISPFAIKYCVNRYGLKLCQKITKRLMKEKKSDKEKSAIFVKMCKEEFGGN
jgi:hypothetical protein